MGLLHYPFVLGGNGAYFSPSGEYQYVLTGTRTVISSGLWRLVTPLAIVGGLVLAGEIAANWRRSDPILGTFTLLAFVAVVGVAIGYGPLFDRYLIPVLPGVAGAALIVRRNAPGGNHRSGNVVLMERLMAPVLRLAGAACMVVIAAISIMLTLNAFAFDSARWHAASKSVAFGLPADRVDGGFEWNGWHSPGPLTVYAWSKRLHGTFSSAPGFDPKPPCTVMTSSPLTASERGQFKLLTVDRYKTFLVAGGSYLYIYATHLPGCPAGMTAADA
jgi:hypothetical protein